MLVVMQGVVQDSSGNAVASPTVEVRRESDNGLASLFSDRAGTTAIGNSFTGNADGTFRCYATPVSQGYKLTATSGALTVTLRNLNDYPIVADGSAAITGLNSLSAVVTDPVLAAPATHFGGAGYTIKGILGAQATWDSNNGGVNGAAAVFESVVESTAGSTGAPGGLFCGVRIKDDIVGLDAHAAAFSVWNDAACAKATGSTIFALVRGDSVANSDYPFGGPVGVNVVNESSVDGHARAGVYVAGVTSARTWKRGVWVSSAVDYGFLVGADNASPFAANPTIAYGCFNTAGTLLTFSVTGADGAIETTSVVTTPTLRRSMPVTETAATHTLASSTTHLICDRAGTVTVTLPAASSHPGREVYIKTIQAQTVVSASSNVVPSTSATAGTAILPATDGAWALLVSNATNWVIMAAQPLV
jgi:hypothetical protein